MPYISVQQRTKFDDWIKELGQRIGSAGELNYCISVLCKHYAKHGGEPNYAKHNEVIGVLECAKLGTPDASSFLTRIRSATNMEKSKGANLSKKQPCLNIDGALFINDIGV